MSGDKDPPCVHRLLDRQRLPALGRARHVFGPQRSTFLKAGFLSLLSIFVAACSCAIHIQKSCAKLLVLLLLQQSTRTASVNVAHVLEESILSGLTLHRSASAVHRDARAERAEQQKHLLEGDGWLVGAPHGFVERGVAVHAVAQPRIAVPVGTAQSNVLALGLLLCIVIRRAAAPTRA